MKWRKRAGLMCLTLSILIVSGCESVQECENAELENKKSESLKSVEDYVGANKAAGDYAGAYSDQSGYVGAYGNTGGYADAYGNESGYLFDYIEYKSRSLTPRMKKYDIRIMYTPVEAAYCTIAPSRGMTSEKRMDLEKNAEFSYYLPDSIGELPEQSVVDIITVRFYDNYAACVHESELLITYDSMDEQFGISARGEASPLEVY